MQVFTVFLYMSGVGCLLGWNCEPKNSSLTFTSILSESNFFPLFYYRNLNCWKTENDDVDIQLYFGSPYVEPQTPQTQVAQVRVIAITIVSVL